MRDLVGSSSGCAKPMPSSHIAALPCTNRLCDSFQLKPATPCGPYLREQRLVHLRRFDRLRRIGHQLALGVDEAAAVAQQEARPHRHVGVLEAAPDEARTMPLRRIVELRRRIDDLREALRIRDVLGVEQLLVVVEHPRIDVERQAVDAAVGLRRPVHAALGEVGEVERRVGERLVGDQRPHVHQPLALAEQPLLHVIRRSRSRRSSVLPELNSITAFCRCCCSGIISDPTVMPVRSSNSLWYLVSRSPRGLLTRKTSIFSPLKRFQSNGALRVRRELAGARHRAERRGAQRRPAAGGGVDFPDLGTIVFSS